MDTLVENIQNKLNEAVTAIFEGYNENRQIAEEAIALLKDFIDTYQFNDKLYTVYVENGFVWIQDDVTGEWKLDIMHEDEAKDAGLEFYPLSNYITITNEIAEDEIYNLVDEINPYDARIER